jgi:hypothetical protein
MASDRRRNCLTCGNHESVVGPISWRGNCGECGVILMSQAVVELHEKRGPTYRRWKRRLIESLNDPAIDVPRVRA